MLKEEFENLIGKEVDFEVFRMYEAMYAAAPETVDKRAFVAMLNLDAIPESERAKKAREEKEERLAEIDEKKAELKAKKAELKAFQTLLKTGDETAAREYDFFWLLYGDSAIRDTVRHVESLKSEITIRKNEIERLELLAA